MAKKPTNSTNIAACKTMVFLVFFKKKGNYTRLEVRDTLELSLVVVSFCVEFFSARAFPVGCVLGCFLYLVCVLCCFGCSC